MLGDPIEPLIGGRVKLRENICLVIGKPIDVNIV